MYDAMFRTRDKESDCTKITGQSSMRLPVILLDDVRVSVMQNLYNALQHLRYPNHERCLWIDYLCINQQSIEDKNAQVSSMHVIYRNASQVVTWLGLPSAHTTEAVAVLSALNPDEHLTTTFGASDTSRSCAMKGLRRLEDLMLREWFQRVWTVQEVVLAYRAKVYVGHLELPWNLFLKAAETFQEHKICCLVHKFQTRDGDREDDFHFLMMSNRFFQISGLERFKCGDSTLHNALFYFATRLATDPRDKVFSLLGFLKPENRLIRVDYAISVPDLYKNVAVAIMQAGSELSILRNVQQPADHISLPSWCPDWRTLGSSGTYYGIYSAAGHSKASVTRCSADSIYLKGKFTDRVSDVILAAPQADRSREQFRACFRFETWKALVQRRFGTKGLYVAGGTNAVALRYTSRMGLADVDPASFTPNYGLWQQWCDWMVRHFWPFTDPLKAAFPDDVRDILLPHDKVLARDVLKRCFFLTEVGYMGLGPEEMRKGDVLWALAGARMPAVLRPVGEACMQCGPQRQCYRFVGFPYVHGLMEGAAIKKIEKGTEAWEDFCLR